MKVLFLSLLIALPVSVVQAGDPVPASGSRAAAVQSELTERDSRANCMRYTGSRIVQSRAERAKRARRGGQADSNSAESDKGDERVASLEPDSCVSANGRVYSRSDLQRTGAVDLADALRMLDSSIR